MDHVKQTVPPQCLLCGKWYALQTAVLRHLNKEHTTINTRGKWPCSTCGKTLTRRNTLSRHTNSIHQDTLPTPAPILCAFKKPTTLIHHNININPSNVRFRIIAAFRPYVYRAKHIPRGKEHLYLKDGRPNPAASLPRKGKSQNHYTC